MIGPEMPLSEHEQRVLEDIERSLLEEDPQFAREAKRASPVFASDRKRIRIGIGISIVGFALLIAFFTTGALVVGVAAFAVMVTGIVVAAGPMTGLLHPRRFSDSSLKDRLSSTARSVDERMKHRFRRRR